MLSLILFISAVFALAGFIKGVIGLGLPTISIGLLAVVMPPVEAAAILILPSFVTNVWQMLAGPSLSAIVRRLWPMMLAVCFGTWAGLGFMTGATARYGTALLGIALALYAVTGIMTLRVIVPNTWEKLFGPLTGAITGVITAATGVFVILFQRWFFVGLLMLCLYFGCTLGSLNLSLMNSFPDWSTARLKALKRIPGKGVVVFGS